MKTLLLPAALVVALLGSAMAGPMPHPPSCSATWLFGTPCSGNLNALLQQIQAYSRAAGCEGCHFNLMSVTPFEIIANHTTDDGVPTELFSFKFMPSAVSGGCDVSASCKSVAFSPLHDNTINLCILYYLVSASGLSAQPDFIDMTTEWICPGFGMIKCEG